MWPDQRLLSLFGIQHPIIQAPMRGSSTLELALAVSEAGGLGSIACAGSSTDELRGLCEAMRERTDAPFNANFFVMDEVSAAGPEQLASTVRLLKTYYDALGIEQIPDIAQAPAPGLPSEIVDAIVELRPPVVSFHFGVPAKEIVHRLRAAGILLMSSATNVAEARLLSDAGVDAIIAQGWEAGGHRGSHTPNRPVDGVGTLALVPQIVDAVDVPVIAAGGIADGRGVAAAFALGASGVQMGTGFLRCPEAATDARRRELLRGATDQDTTVTAAVSGRSARAVRSRYAMEMASRDADLAPFPILLALTAPLRAASLDDDFSFHLYGQAAALSQDVPAGELVRHLACEASAVFDRLLCKSR